MVIQVDRVHLLPNHFLSSFISFTWVRSDDQVLLLVCKNMTIIILKLFLIIVFLIWDRILAGRK